MFLWQVSIKKTLGEWNADLAGIEGDGYIMENSRDSGLGQPAGSKWLADQEA